MTDGVCIMLGFRVNEFCSRCSQCVLDCPARIIRMTDNGPAIPAESEDDCLHCQHCLAICPLGCVSILGKHPEGSLALSGMSRPNLSELTHLVKSRRSVRRYLNQNVDREQLQAVLTASAYAPTGVNNRKLRFLVLDDWSSMDRFRREALTSLGKVEAAGPLKFSYLQGAASAFVENDEDYIFRGAPHLLIVAGEKDAPCPQQDIVIALTTFELLAQSNGWGTVWCGMIWMLLETLPEIKKRFGLAPRQAYYPMLFGHPAVQYARTVQRDDSANVIPISW